MLADKTLLVKIYISHIGKSDCKFCLNRILHNVHKLVRLSVTGVSTCLNNLMV